MEWRVINAAEYGYQQRRRRTFIFAYKNNTKYADRILKLVGYADALKEESMENAILKDGFFAETFPVNKAESTKIKIKELPVEVGEVSEKMCIRDRSFSQINSTRNYLIILI